MNNELAGMRVGVTRPAHQAPELTKLLEDHGAIAIEVGVIAIEDPADNGEALQAVVSDLSGYSWLVFTSANAVDRFVASDPAPFAGSVAAIGPGTAARLSEAGFSVDFVPPQYVAESLVESFPQGKGRVLLPRAAVARDVLPEGLRAKGWTVDVVTAYRTVGVRPDVSEPLDAVTFTSSSTVAAFVESGAAIPAVVACIGPVTARTARDLGLDVTVVAPKHTIPGLVEALVDAGVWKPSAVDHP